MEIPAEIKPAIAGLRRDFSGRLGLWVRDLRRGHVFGSDAGSQFRAASTIKVFVLRELYRQVGLGTVRLDEMVTMRGEDKVIGSGVIADLTPGLRLTLKDLATLMITVSDNTATNLVIDRLGVRAVNASIKRDGFAGTHLGGKLFKGRGVHSVSTPADLGRAMAEIATGSAVNRAASAEMLDILGREQYANIVGRMIPWDPWAKGKAAWKVASKSGSLRGCRNDVAYVEAPDARYVIALMSDGCQDERPYVDNEAHLCLARIAAMVHEFLARQDAHSPANAPKKGPG